VSEAGYALCDLRAFDTVIKRFEKYRSVVLRIDLREIPAAEQIQPPVLKERGIL